MLISRHSEADIASAVCDVDIASVTVVSVSEADIASVTAVCDVDIASVVSEADIASVTAEYCVRYCCF